MELLTILKTDEDKIEELVGILEEDIEELFIASSDFHEMMDTLKLLQQTDFFLEEEHIPCVNKDYLVYVLDSKGSLQSIPNLVK